jgi:hypothetical protein
MTIPTTTSTIEELREMAALTAQIRKNLTIINKNQSKLEELEQQLATIEASHDLEELDKQTSRIAKNLSAIDEAAPLDELDEQTSRIADNLSAIEACGLDLDELERQSAETCRNLAAIEEAS